MLGALMVAGDILLEALPNVHLVGMLLVTYTAVFRHKALIPLYVYVLIMGLTAGFSLWWVPYLYVWLPLWACAMLVPRRAPLGVRCVIYPVICALHGFAFGTLYAPVQALAYGLDFRGMLAWIAAGFYFDLIHGVSNFAFGLLIVPLSNLMEGLTKGRYR